MAWRKYQWRRYSPGVARGVAPKPGRSVVGWSPPLTQDSTLRESDESAATVAAPPLSVRSSPFLVAQPVATVGAEMMSPMGDASDVPRCRGCSEAPTTKRKPNAAVCTLEEHRLGVVFVRHEVASLT
jgi:hypothetical protein